MYREMPVGIRVPYATAEGADTNRRFVDLRGHPEAVGQIAEAQASAALREILMLLADPEASWFSLGCDLGHHVEPRALPRNRQVAGGYLHILSAAYATIDAACYGNLAARLESVLVEKVGNRSWEIAFLLQPVEVTLDGTQGVECASLAVRYFASADRIEVAERAREALLRALAPVFRR